MNKLAKDLVRIAEELSKQDVESMRNKELNSVQNVVDSLVKFYNVIKQGDFLEGGNDNVESLSDVLNDIDSLIYMVQEEKRRLTNLIGAAERGDYDGTTGYEFEILEVLNDIRRYNIDNLWQRVNDVLFPEEVLRKSGKGVLTVDQLKFAKKIENAALACKQTLLEARKIFNEAIKQTEYITKNWPVSGDGFGI